MIYIKNGRITITDGFYLYRGGPVVSDLWKTVKIEGATAIFDGERIPITALDGEIRALHESELLVEIEEIV